jgi:hypothetical protein
MAFRLLLRSTLFLALVAPAAASAQAQPGTSPVKSGFFIVSAKARLDNISRASLFEPLDISQLDTRAGRQLQPESRNLPNDVTIECYYKYGAPGGVTPKFRCVGPRNPNDSTARLPVIVTNASGEPVDVKVDLLKVRYGSVKVFSSVITTRLEWALGFGSDIETPVAKVICHGCSPDPVTQTGPVDATNAFPRPGARAQVSVEQSLEGTGIYVRGMRFDRDNGEDNPSWNWSELDVITDPDRKAQADALKLFAAFIQHVDNKGLQNRLLCRSAVDSAGACPDPVLYIHDLGNTLGTNRNFLFLHGTNPLNFEAWKQARVWNDEHACVAALQMISRTGPGLTNPRISEAGRRLLADRLTMLINARNSDGSSKLRDIFDAAHIEKYDDHGRHYSADDWVTVFVMRAKQITGKSDPCPQ